MKRFIQLFVVSLISLVAFSCSKSEKEVEPLKFDFSTNSLTKEERSKAATFMTLWSFQYKKNNEKEHKLIGSSSSQSGESYNVVLNSVGTSDRYAYFKFDLKFEASNQTAAEKLRQAIGASVLIKYTVYAGAKNIGHKDFVAERDLGPLNEAITASIIHNLVNVILPNEFKNKELYIVDYTKAPLKVVDRDYKYKP